MARVKNNPNSKYGLEVVIIGVSEKFAADNPQEIPPFSTKDNIVICQSEDGLDDFFRLYFHDTFFMESEDDYLYSVIMGVMISIDEKTGDPDPDMDLQFSTYSIDKVISTSDINLREKINRVLNYA